MKSWDAYDTIGDVVLRFLEVFRRKVHMVHMMTSDVETYLLLEGLLTAYTTVYEPESWPKDSRAQAHELLDDRYRRFK
jgi:hypothetical protein